MFALTDKELFRNCSVSMGTSASKPLPLIEEERENLSQSLFCTWLRKPSTACVLTFFHVHKAMMSEEMEACLLFESKMGDLPRSR